MVAVGVGALVAPGVLGRALAGPVALVECAEDGGAVGPVRYGSEARSVLALRGDEAFVVEIEAGRASPVRSSFGYPFGAFAFPLQGTSLGAGSGARLRAWWQVALAVETVGTMDAALTVTLGYLKQRRQFGRAIGSFQAVQHRLAECAVWLEGARWLAYEAAALGATAEGAATAAAHAAMAAKRVFAETHQLTGAIGYTREHDLHVFSMRLQALRLELGGVGAHRREAARARCGAGG